MLTSELSRNIDAFVLEFTKVRRATPFQVKLVTPGIKFVPITVRSRFWFPAVSAVGFNAVIEGRRLGWNPIAAVLVNWTDQGTPESGYVHFTDAHGDAVQTPSYNIGSGETELIPLDGKVPKDGIIHVSGGSHLGVKKIEVLYAQ